MKLMFRPTEELHPLLSATSASKRASKQTNKMPVSLVNPFQEALASQNSKVGLESHQTEQLSLESCCYRGNRLCLTKKNLALESCA